MSLLSRIVERASGPDGDAVAVRFDRRYTTYFDLVDMARDLAKRLENRSDPVTLDIPKSDDLIVAMLACWMANRAFFPLDRSSPETRREECMSRVGSATTITAEETISRSGEDRVSRAFGITETPCDDEYPGWVADAYIICTSGTTGRPKAVVVGHDALEHTILAQIKLLGVGDEDCVSMLLSSCFDASLSDVFVALASGACLVIPDDSVNLGTMIKFIRDSGITCADVPTALVRVTDPEDIPLELRVVVVGGEPCPPEKLRAWARKVRVVNVYGPTEAAICSSACDVDPAHWVEPKIGIPLPHVRHRVIDERMQDVEEDELGELLIMGKSLAKGYVNDQDLTLKKFVWTGSGRAYKTGDIVRRRADENHIFVGRMDRQVKIRGKIVSPEEVETAICAFPGVRSATVYALTKAEGGMSMAYGLEAHVVGSISGLEEFLRGRLPDWMIPHINGSERLKESSAGKVRHVDARTATLVTAASHVLDLPVGPDDDFFDDVGGDSLAAMELVAEAEIRGIPMDSDAPWRGRTPRGMAVLVRSVSSTITELRKTVPEPTVGQRLAWSGRGLSGKGVVITGANGFLGSRLVDRLSRAGINVSCVVRASSNDEAMARITKVLPSISEPRKGTIKAFAGDASTPWFGMDPGGILSLVQSCSAMISCAAKVSVVHPTSELLESNLETVRVAASVCSAAGLNLHHISTLSVLVSTDMKATWPGITGIMDTARMLGGYACSKWMAEEFLRLCGPHATHRLGLLTGDSSTGVGFRDGQLERLIRGISELGMVPEGDHASMMFDTTPVDFAVDRIVERVLLGKDGLNHVCASHASSLSELLEAIRSEVGPVRVVPQKEFMSAALASGSSDVMSAVLSLGDSDAGIFLMTGKRIKCSDSIFEAKSVKVIPDGDLLRKYVREAR